MPVTPDGILKLSDAQLRAVGSIETEVVVCARSGREDESGVAGFLTIARTNRRRSDPASDAGQRRWSVDRAHVPDVHVAARKYSSDRRLRRSGGHEEALSQAKTAQAEGYGEDREGMVAVPIDRLLVFVAKSRHQDLITTQNTKGTG